MYRQYQAVFLLRYGPGLDGTLEHWHYDTFRVLWDARWRGKAFASFVLDRNGEPVSLEFRGARFQRPKTIRHRNEGRRVTLDLCYKGFRLSWGPDEGDLITWRNTLRGGRS